MDEFKRLESRLRRVAHRQGLQLIKSRRRDLNAWDHGMYALIDPRTGFTVHKHGPVSEFYLTLEDVREWLEEI